MSATVESPLGPPAGACTRSPRACWPAPGTGPPAPSAWRSPCGPATSRAYGDFSLIVIEGTDLVVLRGGQRLGLPLTGTCGDLAAAAGLPVERLCLLERPFGAACPLSDLLDLHAVVDFYRTANALAGQPP